MSAPPEPGVAADAAAWTDAGSGIEPATAEEPAQPPPTEPSVPDPGAAVTVSAEEIIGTETLDSREAEAPPVPDEPASPAIAETEHAEPEHVPEAQARDSIGVSGFEIAREPGAEVAPEELDELERHHEALRCYQAQDWNGAETLFNALRERSPERKLYEIYLERIRWFRELPPGPDWDGVYTFTTK